uniref:Uncharacterized protein n=1 Tax=Cyclophora tenuis TaxID=216820 RepID=A0A7S1CXZ1_CYCTE
MQEMGCGTFWALASKQENRPILARAGAASRIIRALVKHIHVEDVVLRALGTLRTLSSEMEVRQDLVALEAPQHVAQAMAMHRDNPAVQRDGCAFLSNSAVDVERQQVAVATKAEIEAIVEAMSHHQNDPSVLSGATFALKNYSFMEKNIRTLLSCHDAVKLLDYTMKNCTDTNGRDDAVIVLERIQTCFTDDENLEDTVYRSMMESVELNPHSSSGVNQVFHTMKEYDWSSRIVAGGLDAIQTLLHRSPSHKNKVRGEILITLMSMMSRHEDSAAVQLRGCALLAIMAGSEEKCRHTIRDANGLLVIVRAMRNHMNNVDVQVAATSALKVLSVEFDCWFELERSGNTGIVTEAMGAHPGSFQLQENGTQILTRFSSFAAEIGIAT